MKKNNSKYKLSMHETVPELVLDKASEVASMVAKYKNSKSPNPKLSKWYEDLELLLKTIFFYIQNTKYIHERNSMLESQNKHFAFLIQQLEDQLNEFRVVSRLTSEGRLDDIRDIVNSSFEVEIAKKYRTNGSNRPLNNQ